MIADAGGGTNAMSMSKNVRAEDVQACCPAEGRIFSTRGLRKMLTKY
jgi:hypothetical protein